MSNPFSYEIDERNLRIQLKNLEMPMRDEAWLKFESYMVAHPLSVSQPAFSPMQFKLNRSIVMPAIFGGIILLFSIILYNFVSINKNKEEDKQFTAAEAETLEVVEAPPVIEQEISASTPSPAAVVAATVAAPVVPEKQEIKSVKLVAEPKPAPEKTEQPPVIATTGDSAQTIAPEQTTGSTKKKRRRSEENSETQALKPTIVSEDEQSVEVPQ